MVSLPVLLSGFVTFRNISLVPFVLLAIYFLLLFLLTIPWVQRHATYAHKIYPGGHHSKDFGFHGFGDKQVTEFDLKTADGETLNAWHVLPLNVYAEHRSAIVNGSAKAFNLLRDNPDAKVVVYFHGVAGNVQQGWRTYAYRYMTDMSNVHVIAIDYRGFGLSSGSPSEQGLITDGITVVDFVLHDLRIPAHRILIFGQSLGTAVASAIALYYIDPTSSLLPSTTFSSTISNPCDASSIDSSTGPRNPVIFAGIVLVAPFASFPDLLLWYNIKGVFPLFSPLTFFPSIQRAFLSFVPDTWDTAARLTAYDSLLTKHYARVRSQGLVCPGGGDLTIVHAINDREIAIAQTAMLVKQMTGRTLDTTKHGPVDILNRAGEHSLVVDIVAQGGHSRIVTSASVMLAIRQSFEIYH